MSNEFKDRLARGELTSIEEYKRMKDALAAKDDTGEEVQASQEWQNWELSPVWTPGDSPANKSVDDTIPAEGVLRALDRLDKN